MPTLKVTSLFPGTAAHIAVVIGQKHKGKKTNVLYKIGGEVTYLLDDKI